MQVLQALALRLCIAKMRQGGMNLHECLHHGAGGFANLSSGLGTVHGNGGLIWWEADYAALGLPASMALNFRNGEITLIPEAKVIRENSCYSWLSILLNSAALLIERTAEKNESRRKNNDPYLSQGLFWAFFCFLGKSN